MASRRMDDSRRDVLRRNTMLFKTDMTCVSDVVAHLYSNFVLNESMKDEILECRGRGEQAVQLHSRIPKRGDNAFDFYYLALRDTNNDVLADVLEPHLCNPLIKTTGTPAHTKGPVQETVAKSPVTSPTDDEPPDVPPVWPDVTASPLDVKVKKCRPDDVDMKKKFMDDDNVYCMKSKSMRILIINNEKFENAKDTNEALDTRDGTNIDATSLDMVFRQMGFRHIRTEPELTGLRILKTLKEEAADRKRTDEGFMCFILSHGNVGSVYGTDGVPVSLEDIYKQFDGKMCRALLGKPKLFFIQACQGTKKDDTKQSPTPEENVAELEEQFKDLHLPREASDSSADVATKADMLVATATTAGYVSWRNIEHGSWFIQSLVYMLKNHAHKYDLQKILTLTNRMVGQNATQKGGYKQAAEKRDTLRKDFYFFPGLGEGSDEFF
ncbi:cell death protein 3-like [Liolophura sinensis]|uniref:cell death protein 3-like n=1 Tax=Liolophura sinensis TaxID=3198878 RepID=UPI0031580E16